MTSKIFCFLFLVLGVFASGSCVNDQSTSSTDFNRVKNSVWRLFSFDTIGVSTATVIPADTILLWFEAPHRLRGTGRGRCVNEYDGFYTLGPDGVTRFDTLSTTKRGCSSGSRYGDYWNQLHEVSSFSVTDLQLCLYYNGSNSRMLFIRMP